jgi:hypothetical protein
LGFYDDNILVMMITGLNDKSIEVRNSALLGLSHFGIADKQGLKRAMIELGIIKGEIFQSSYAGLEKIQVRQQAINEIERKQTVGKVEDWLKTKVTPTQPTMIRTDSYFENLAGPFFPPDAHDISGKEKYRIMCVKANPEYNFYWKDKCLSKNSIRSEKQAQADELLISAHKLTKVPKPIKERNIKSAKQPTAADIALKVGRVMSIGGMCGPVKSNNLANRPKTAASPSYLSFATNRPKTSLPSSISSKIGDLKSRTKTALPLSIGSAN